MVDIIGGGAIADYMVAAVIVLGGQAIVSCPHIGFSVMVSSPAPHIGVGQHLEEPFREQPESHNK